MFKTYLGDSVYVEIEGGMFKLSTENGMPTDPSNVIFLEPEVYEALKRYAEHHLSANERDDIKRSE